MKTTILKTCETSWEAHLIKAKLLDAGIPCFVANENSSALMPHFYQMMGSGTQVVVYKDDLTDAQKIIGDTKEEITCPECGSNNITFSLGNKKLQKIFFILLSIFVFIPFSNIRNKNICKDCKTEF